MSAIWEYYSYCLIETTDSRLKMNKFKDFPALFYVGFYHPKYNYYEDTYEDNHYFNEFSQYILDLKNGDLNAIIYFKNLLLKLMEDEEIIIITVPPHMVGESSGIQKLAKCLVRDSKSYIDATQCLERFKTVPRSSQNSASRSEDTHLGSIRINNSSLVKNQNVILLDDVITTGSSTNACLKILAKMGAKEVKIICLGKAIRQVEYAHYLVKEKLQEEIQSLAVEHHSKTEEIENHFDYEISNLDRADCSDQWLEEIYELESSMRCDLNNTSDWINSVEAHLCECAEEAHQALCGEDYLTPTSPFLEVFRDLDKY
jgi:predicted amidophosphoribosyltransferase